MKCKNNLFPQDDNQNQCGKCPYPVRNFETGETTHCVLEMASKGRVVPEYTSKDKNVDWRDWGVVSPVQDQASCGSCFAFATAAAAETAFAIKTGELHKISE